MAATKSRQTTTFITPLYRSTSIDSGISGIRENVDSQLQDKRAGPPEFKPSTRLYLAFLTLAVITMAVALDGTSLSVALPVRPFKRKQLPEAAC